MMRFANALRCLFVIAFLAATVAPVLADRKPTPEERARIETVLRQHGYTRWGDIEFDDDEQAWEVDDAVGPDGREQYLKLEYRWRCRPVIAGG